MFCFIHQSFGFSDVYKSSGYNIRTCKNLIAVFFKRQYHDQNTVLRQMLSVAKNDISDITNTQSVYQDRSGLYTVYNLCFFFI